MGLSETRKTCFKTKLDLNRGVLSLPLCVSKSKGNINLPWNSKRSEWCRFDLYSYFSSEYTTSALRWPFDGKFPVTLNFRESPLCCVYRESVWWRESLPPTQESLWEALSCVFTSSSLHFVYLSPSLTPSFSLSLPVNPGVAYEVTVFPLPWLCGLIFFFFCLSYLFLHSGVTLFHSPTQGITLLKGTLLDLVGSCTRSTVWVTWHVLLLVPKTDRSRHSVCLRAVFLLSIRTLFLYHEMAGTGLSDAQV